MRIFLTNDGQKRYKEACRHPKFSDEEKQERQDSGKRSFLTYYEISDRMGFGWTYDKVKRFFGGDPDYSVWEDDAKAICKILKIVFDPGDYIDFSDYREQLSNHKKKYGSESSFVYLPALKQTHPSGKRLDEREGRKDVDVVPEDKVLVDQQPCNPAALSAAVSQGSIPDLFDSSHFHLKVRVKETFKSSFNIREQDTGGEAPLSCWLLYSIYNGQYPFTKVSSSNKDKALNKDSFMTNDMDLETCCSKDPLYFLAVDPSPLIDAIGRLCNYVLALCRKHLSDNQLPLVPIVHLHLLLPVSWLSGPLPEAIRQGLKRQVFFCCSDRSTRKRLSGSAITQLQAQALRVNQSLHSGSALSSLRWSTVCGGDTQTLPLAQLFQSIPEVIHLSDCDLGIKTDYCELVGRDALLAAEHRFLFAEQFSGAGEGSAEDRMDQRWRRLVEIGLPLVFWWRDPGALAESARVDRLEAVLKGSWSEFCNALQHLEWSTNPKEQNNLAMNALLSNLGIFYEEPLRCISPETFSL